MRIIYRSEQDKNNRYTVLVNNKTQIPRQGESIYVQKRLFGRVIMVLHDINRETIDIVIDQSKI